MAECSVQKWHSRASWAIQWTLTHIRNHCYCKTLLSMLFYSLFFWPVFDDVFLSKKQNHPLVLLTSLTSGLSRLHCLLPLGIVNQTQLMRLQAHTNPYVNKWQMQNWRIPEWKSYLPAFKLIRLPWIGSKLCFLTPVLLKGKIILTT